MKGLIAEGEVDFLTDGGRGVKGLSGSLVLDRGLVTQRRMPPDSVAKDLEAHEANSVYGLMPIMTFRNSSVASLML